MPGALPVELPLAPPAAAGAAAALTAAAPAIAKVHPALAHAMKAGVLQTDRATRAFADARATAEVFALGGDPDVWRELMRIQEASWRRLRTLQDGWLKDWAQWLQYAGQIRGANTMSKLVERENNIGAQLAQVIGAQVTDLVGLQENIEIAYSYWINTKLSEKRNAL
jgi:hypothetical protein